MNKVSIVLPTLNGGRYIRQSIVSCLNQTHSDIELIIVDGGSTDETITIIEEIKDSRIQLIHQPANSGRLPGAINLGLEHSTGNFLTWTSDDNWYETDACERMLQVFEINSKIDFVYTDYWRVGPEGQILTYVRAEAPEVWLPSGTNGPILLCRRSVYDIIGGQDVDVPLAADFEYWLRAWKYPFTLQPINIPFYSYRIHKKSITGREGHERFMLDTEKSLELWLNQNPYIFPSRYRRMVGAGYIALAFEIRPSKDYQTIRSHLIRGLRYDPRYLKNRGVLSLLIESYVSERMIKRLRRIF